MLALVGALAAVPTLTAFGSAGPGIRVTRAPGPAPVVGRAWFVTLRVSPATFRGAVALSAVGPTTLVARAQGGGGAYRARFVFPSTGVWKLTARAGTTRASLGTVRVRPVPALTLREPTGIAVEPTGALAVVELGRQRLVDVDADTGRLRRVAALAKPWGVARGPSGLFVGDRNALERVEGGSTTTVATVDAGTEIGPVAVSASGDVFYATATALYRVPDGRAGAAQRLVIDATLDSPHGLAVAADGALLVSDTNHGRILRIDLAARDATTFATLEHPRGLAVAPDGSVFAAAADEHRIVRFDASGRRLGVVGPRLNDPYAIAIARDGTIYAVEPGPSGFIRRIRPDGSSSVVPQP